MLPFLFPLMFLIYIPPLFIKIRFICLLFSERNCFCFHGLAAFAAFPQEDRFRFAHAFKYSVPVCSLHAGIFCQYAGTGHSRIRHFYHNDNRPRRINPYAAG